ncbi:unnamed protein product [Rhizophagus irregularis]|nr:unnamed protein product [Rhizophagus irregularis]CAB4421556.1 unnamed protein product [Rhizophagus irregularis]
MDKVDHYFRINRNRAIVKNQLVKGNTLLPYEAQANNNLFMNVIQRESEVLVEQFNGNEENTFFQKAIRKNESDNNIFNVKNICKIFY